MKTKTAQSVSEKSVQSIPEKNVQSVPVNTVQSVSENGVQGVPVKTNTVQSVPAVLLGLCPLLCVCANVQSGFATAVTALAVYVLSIPVLSLADRIIPGRWNAGYMRIFLLAAASAGWSVLAGILLEAFLPALYAQIGVYVPLNVVFCVLLDLSGFSAAWDTAVLSRKFAGGAVFIFTLTLAGLIREFSGAGTVCGVITVLPAWVTPVGIFTRIPGAFLTAALILIVCNAWRTAGNADGYTGAENVNGYAGAGNADGYGGKEDSQ